LLYTVQVGFIAECDEERHNADAQGLRRRWRDIGGAIGDDTNGHVLSLLKLSSHRIVFRS
jgi:hypothetical protein